MALAFDAISSSAAGTTQRSWTHTPVGTPRGVLVMVTQAVGVTNEITSVTYGGVAMTAVPLSPLVKDAGTEDGVVYGFHLGASIPTGAQTVVVNVNGTGSNKRASAITVTAATDTEVEDTSTLNSSSAANPSVTLTTSVTTYIVGGLYSGHNDPSGVAPASGYTDVIENDYGNTVGAVIRANAPVASGSPTVGWTAGVAEKSGILGIAIKEAAADTPTRGRISYAELEVPFLATRGRVSYAELEVPTRATRGRVSFAELEVPAVQTRGRISYAELEVPELIVADPTRGRVSFAELEVPFVGTRGRVSFAELEVPLAPTRGRVSLVELEVPLAPTRGRASWAELEVPLAPTRGRVSMVELEVPEFGAEGGDDVVYIFPMLLFGQLPPTDPPRQGGRR